MIDKRDIETREDLEILLERFYNILLADEGIGYLFTEVARIDMSHHLPLITDFWDSILLGSGTYRKDAMQPHLILHSKSPLQKHHFEIWLHHFKQTVDQLFEGPKALLAKQRAESIATLIQIKIAQTRG